MAFAVALSVPLPAQGLLHPLPSHSLAGGSTGSFQLLAYAPPALKNSLWLPGVPPNFLTEPQFPLGSLASDCVLHQPSQSQERQIPQSLPGEEKGWEAKSSV